LNDQNNTIMKKLTFFLLTLATTLTLQAQIAINKTGSTPTPASILHVKGDATDKNIILEPGTNGGVSIGTADTPTHKLTIQSEDDNKALRLIGTIAPFGVGAQLNFGDGNFTYIKESGDDSLTIYAAKRTSIMGGNVGIGTTTPDPSSMLDIKSNTKGILIPRTDTTMVNNAQAPVAGLIIYQLSDNKFYYYNGTKWIIIATGTNPVFERNGTTIRQVAHYGTDNFIIGRNLLPANGEYISDSLTLLFFDKSKGAFRTGTIEFSTNWSPDSIGYGSVAFGLNTKAKGIFSTAWGIVSNASGVYSTAWGYLSSATGYVSTAWGSNTIAKASYETALGQYNKGLTPFSATTWDNRDVLFVIGNGTNSSNKHNALTLWKDGRLGLGDAYEPTYALQLPNNSNIDKGQAKAYAWVT
jgi:hypothetical protein